MSGPKRASIRVMLALAVTIAPPCASSDAAPEGPGGPRAVWTVIVIDLDDDGFYLGDAAYAVAFDADGDGRTERVHWTAADTRDGFLWFDRDGDGQVGDGGELLATGAAVGLAALRALEGDPDTGNGDGALDADDPVWPRLGLWLDADQDGVASAREARPLARHRIRRIRLEAVDEVWLDGSLNRFRRLGRFDRRDGGQGSFAEVDLELVER